jgi:hypothetical protein
MVGGLSPASSIALTVESPTSAALAKSAIVQFRKARAARIWDPLICKFVSSSVEQRKCLQGPKSTIFIDNENQYD